MRSFSTGVGKLALIKHQRYAHVHQFKRANRGLHLKTYLGRVIRDIGRRIAGDDVLEEIFARELSLARCVLAQDRHQRADARSIRCMRRRSSASVRARRIDPTNSAAR
jgi:IS5 family transposase